VLVQIAPHVAMQIPAALAVLAVVTIEAFAYEECRIAVTLSGLSAELDGDYYWDSTSSTYKNNDIELVKGFGSEPGRGSFDERWFLQTVKGKTWWLEYAVCVEDCPYSWEATSITTSTWRIQNDTRGGWQSTTMATVSGGCCKEKESICKPHLNWCFEDCNQLNPDTDGCSPVPRPGKNYTARQLNCCHLETDLGPDRESACRCNEYHPRCDHSEGELVV
jgi:hypothetical protein